MMRYSMEISDHEKYKGHFDVIIEALQLLGCSLEDFNEHEMHFPIKIDYHYNFSLYIDFEHAAVRLISVIERNGSLEYLQEIFGGNYQAEEEEGYFIIRLKIDDDNQVDAEKLALSLADIKEKSMLFLH